MEHKAVKKAKKGLFSIVFGRTALILMLVLIQLIILVGVATILNDYAVYVYGGFTVLAAVIVIYIINERGNPAFNMTWVLMILIFPAFGCLFYIWVKSQLEQDISESDCVCSGLIQQNICSRSLG